MVTKQNRQGFTLLELSIVLVIIGLLAGGVLVGQELIKAATIRATVGEYEKYNTAVNAFRSKYNCLPGDCLQRQANAFGLYNISAPGAGTVGGRGNGDGDGLLMMQNNNGGVQQIGDADILEAAV